MSSPATGRLADAAGATGRFLGRPGPWGWLTLGVLAAFPAALPAALAVVYGVGPPWGLSRSLARQAPGAVETLRSVPELAVVPGVLAVGALVALYVHSVAETAFVRALRGGGPGWFRSFAVGARLFCLRVGLLAALLCSLAVLASVVGGPGGDPVDALVSAIPTYGPALAVLVPVALLVDLVTVDAVVPVVLADPEPERGVEVPPPEGEGWGEAAWRRARADDRESGSSRWSTGEADRTNWSSGAAAPDWVDPTDRDRTRGVLAAWRRLWRTASNERDAFLTFLAVRVLLEVLVVVVTGAAFLALVWTGAFATVLVLLVVVLVVQFLPVPPLVGVAAFFLLLPLALGMLAFLTGLVHAPFRALARYYGMLVVGDLDPDLDAVPERRAAIRAIRRREAETGSGGGDDPGEGAEGPGDRDGETGQ